MEHHHDHCIVLNLNDQKITCFQCELEIIDELGKNSQILFEIRRLYQVCKVIENQQNLNLSLFQKFSHQNNYLMSSLLILNSIPFIKKTFKDQKLIQNFVEQKHGVKINNNLIYQLSSCLYMMDEQTQSQNLCVNLYKALIKKQNKFGSYTHKIKSDYFENNQFEEVSPFSECFSGQLKIKNKCKICENSFFTRSEFASLNFDFFQTQQKAQIKKSRKNYFNLLSDEICSKRNGFFRSFEKFQLGVFDYIYDFLHRDEIECQRRPSEQFKFQNQKNFCLLNEQEQESKNIFYCENCLMDVNAQKKYSIVNLPQFLLIGFNKDTSNQKLTFKLEQKLNLSYFLNKQKEGESILFTQNIIEQNNILKKQKQKQEPLEYLYELDCFVRQINHKNQSFFEVNLKQNDKWLQISPLQYNEIPEENFNRYDDQNNQIVFCMYKKFQQDVQKKLKICQQIENKKQKNLQIIPDNFINRYLHLNEKIKFSGDYYICKHNYLKPQFEDIFNKNKACLSYQIDKNLFKNMKPIIQNVNKKNGCYTVFNYLKNAEQVPQNISDYFLQNNYETQKQIDLTQTTLEKCTDCDVQMKKFTLERIFHKALAMVMLQKNLYKKNNKQFYIDIIWFNNYKLFLQADIKNDFNSKLFFNYKYITEKMNQNMNQYYEHFKPNYENDVAVANNEFVAINQNFYQVLEKVFGADFTIFLNSQQKLEFCQNEEMKNIIQKVNFPFEQKFILKKLTQGIQKHDLQVYDKLINLNKKINVLFDFKLNTELKVLNIKEKNQPTSFLIQKQIHKIVKVFKTSSIDKIQFNPCEEIFNIYANHNQDLEQKRRTYMVERENSNKMKNKYGYRKTVIGINSYQESIFNKAQTYCNNFIKEKNFKKSILASIDSNIKKKIKQQQNQSQKRKTRISIFEEISQKVQDIAKQSQNVSDKKPQDKQKSQEQKDKPNINLQDNEISNYTTSQIFSVEQSQLEDSLIPKRINQSQQKTSILANMMNSQNTNKTKFSLFVNKVNIDIEEKGQSQEKLKSLNGQDTFSSSEINDDQIDNSEIFESSHKSSYILESKEEIEFVQNQHMLNNCNIKLDLEQSIKDEKKLSLSQRVKESDFDPQEKETLVTIMQNGDSFDDNWIEELEQPNLNNEDFSDYQVSIKLKRKSDSTHNSDMKKSYFSQIKKNSAKGKQQFGLEQIPKQISHMEKLQIKKDSKSYIKKLMKNSGSIYAKVKDVNQIDRTKKNKKQFKLVINKQEEDKSNSFLDDKDSINQDFDKAFNLQKQPIKHRKTLIHDKLFNVNSQKQNQNLFQSQTIGTVCKKPSKQSLNMSDTKQYYQEKNEHSDYDTEEFYKQLINTQIAIFIQNLKLNFSEIYNEFIQQQIELYKQDNQNNKQENSIKQIIKQNTSCMINKALSDKKLDVENSTVKSCKSKFNTPTKRVLFSEFIYKSTPKKENQDPLSKFRYNKTEVAKERKDSCQTVLFQKISLDNKQFIISNLSMNQDEEKKQAKQDALNSGGFTNPIIQQMLTKDQLLEQDERYKYLSEFGEEIFSNQNHHEILVILPQIPSTPIYYRSNQFRKNNPTIVNISDRKLEQIPLIEGEESAKKLILKSNQISKIENLVSLPQLEEIDLSENQIKKIESLENVINIQVIKLNSNKIKKIENLSLMQSLKVLYLRNNKIENLSNLSNLKHLEDLDISFNRIEQIEVKKIVPKLEILNISSNQLINLEGFENFPNLKNLNLKDNDFDSQEDLLKLNNNLKIKELVIEEDEQDLIDFLALNLTHVKFINGNSIKKIKKKAHIKTNQEIIKNHTQINLSNQSSQIPSDKTFSQHQSLQSDISGSEKFYDISENVTQTKSVKDETENENSTDNMTKNFHILKNQNFNKEQLNENFESPKKKDFQLKENDDIKDNQDIKKQVDQDLKNVKQNKNNSFEEETQNQSKISDKFQDLEDTQHQEESENELQQEQKSDKNEIQNIDLDSQKQVQNEIFQRDQKPWELSLRDRTDDNIIEYYYQKLQQEFTDKKQQKKSKNFQFIGNKQYPIGYVQRETPKSIRVVGDGFYEFFEEIQQYQQIEQLSFEYVLVENLIIKSNRTQLDKLKKLKILKFSFNNIREYLELINFENIPNLTQLYIKNNPVVECDLLKYFIYYRYSKIENFNDHLKTDEELEKTKEIYLDFDKTLQKLHKINLKKFKLQNSDKQKISKKIAESFIQNIQNRYFSEKNFDALFDQVIEAYVDSIIDS